MTDILGVIALSVPFALDIDAIAYTENKIRKENLKAMRQRLGIE